MTVANIAVLYFTKIRVTVADYPYCSIDRKTLYWWYWYYNFQVRRVNILLSLYYSNHNEQNMKHVLDMPLLAMLGTNS